MNQGLPQQPSSNTFEKDLKEWVELDKQYDFLQEKVKAIRERKTVLLKKISEYAKERNLENKVINIPNKNDNKGGVGSDKIKISSIRVYTPLTLKYLEKTLGDIIKNPTQLEQTVGYIKNKRDVKFVTDLKRIE